MPIISVVIPVFNAEKFITKCVQSIQQQTIKDIEIILVDDGSKDDSLNICTQLSSKDQRIKVFHKQNGGASSARRYGVEHAIGEFITFVDSDDTIPYGALNAFIDNDSIFEFDIIQGARRFIPLNGDNEKISAFKKEEICDSTQYLNYLFKGYTNAGPVGTLYKRTLFGNETFDLPNDVKLNEDFYMNLCVGLKANKIKLTNAIVYNYLENACSVTHNYEFSTIIPTMHLLENIKNRLKESGKFELFAKLYYKRWISTISSTCFHNSSLLHDTYVKKGATEAKPFLVGIREKSLCYLLLHPHVYAVFVFANKIRQFLYGYKQYK